MNQDFYHLFATPLGYCGIAWKMTDSSPRQPVVTSLQLPEATKELTEAKMIAFIPGVGVNTPTPAVAGLIKKIQAHLQGARQDFSEVIVDLAGVPAFAQQVYQAARKILAGQTMTYGELAQAINRPTAARAVGQALGRNPIPLIIPCHRVLAAGGKSGGFSAPGGLVTKARLLGLEGVVICQK
ncbi:MAG: methylated-DNA--[protein]-cysteine S-methyltransferase [Desulfobulbaceae bacterium]|nr:methylated-DNA--[protein]-cysteine S-methyltransferase [Desulfobulbaceae bacterium]